MTRTIDNKMGLEWRDRIIVPGQIADCGEVRVTIFPKKSSPGLWLCDMTYRDSGELIRIDRHDDQESAKKFADDWCFIFMSA